MDHAFLESSADHSLHPVAELSPSDYLDNSNCADSALLFTAELDPPDCSGHADCANSVPISNTARSGAELGLSDGSDHVHSLDSESYSSAKDLVSNASLSALDVQLPAFGDLVPVILPNDAHLAGDVISLSSQLLSTDQIKALSTSTKFREAPSKVP